MRSPPEVAGLMLMILLDSSCGSSNGTEPDSGSAASLVVVSGGDQRGEVGTELPNAVVVQVRDAEGQPVANQIINVVVVEGGGSVFAGSAQTNAQGEARERWTLGTVAGEQALEARAVDQSTGDPVVFGRITATAAPGPIAFLSLDSQLRLFLGRQLDLTNVIHATDRYGNEISDPPLSLSAEPPLRIEGTRLSSSAETRGANVTVTSGEFSASQYVMVIRDLSVELVGATGGYSCDGVDALGRHHQSTSMVVDSVVYHASIEIDILIYISATTTITLSDGTIETTSGTGGSLQARQWPGGIAWEWPESTLMGTAVQISESPLTYAGGNGCYWFTPKGPDNFRMSK